MHSFNGVCLRGFTQYAVITNLYRRESPLEQHFKFLSLITVVFFLLFISAHNVNFSCWKLCFLCFPFQSCVSCFSFLIYQISSARLKSVGQTVPLRQE